MEVAAERHIISVVLLPNESDSQSLVDYSSELGKVLPSAIKLGDGCLPHITVVQFLAEEAETEQLWREIQPHTDTVTELTSIGLSFVPGRSRDEIWVALDFMKSAALEKLQDIVLATAFAQTHETNNGTGDMYWPHCTLALFTGKQTTQLDLSAPLFRRAFIGLTLAVATNGPNRTVAKVNFS